MRSADPFVMGDNKKDPERERVVLGGPTTY